jgi:hypothetical protein
VKATGLGSGVEVERQDGLVYGFRDGKIVRLDYYNSRQQALEAVGLGGVGDVAGERGEDSNVLGDMGWGDVASGGAAL